MTTGQKQSLCDFNNCKLKEMLRERGQTITGNKGELVARLLHCDPQIENRLRVGVEECAQEGIDNGGPWIRINGYGDIVGFRVMESTRL